LQELRSIASSNSNVRVLQIDLKDYDKYSEIVSQVKDVVKDEGLNVLFNSAGISPRSSFLGLKALKPNELMDVFAVNCIAPLMLSKAFVPLLKKASETKKDAPLGVQRAVIVNMSKFQFYSLLFFGVNFKIFQAQFSAQSPQTEKVLSITIDSQNQVLMQQRSL
jgi:NAD(P)-dependent dehydrogenase (short-subunit alcohol dehydrogenase family)